LKGCKLNDLKAYSGWLESLHVWQFGSLHKLT